MRLFVNPIHIMSEPTARWSVSERIIVVNFGEHFVAMNRREASALQAQLALAQEAADADLRDLATA